VSPFWFLYVHVEQGLGEIDMVTISPVSIQPDENANDAGAAHLRRHLSLLRRGLRRHSSVSLTDLGANLAQFRERFAKILSSQRDLSEDVVSVADEEDQQAFRLFYDRFYQYIAGQLRRANALIADYERLVDTVP